MARRGIRTSPGHVVGNQQNLREVGVLELHLVRHSSIPDLGAQLWPNVLPFRGPNVIRLELTAAQGLVGAGMMQLGKSAILLRLALVGGIRRPQVRMAIRVLTPATWAIKYTSNTRNCSGPKASVPLYSEPSSDPCLCDMSLIVARLDPVTSYRQTRWVPTPGRYHARSGGLHSPLWSDSYYRDRTNTIVSWD